jgi:hypothetical protein
LTLSQITIMPQWLKTIFSVRKDAPYGGDGHDPEWAEFNLPASSDLRALYVMRAERGPHAQSSRGA